MACSRQTNIWDRSHGKSGRAERSCIVGPVNDFPTEATAQKAVAALRANINAGSPRTQIDALSFGTLVQHYRERELNVEAGKTFATIRTNEGYLERWILPRWSSYRLKDIKAVIVEEWLRALPLANGSEAKNSQSDACNIQSRGSLGMARQESHHTRSAKCQTAESARHFSVEQIKALLGHLEEPGRTAYSSRF